MANSDTPHNPVEIDGIQMPGHLTSKERFEELKSIETTEKDIILAGYPRCGKWFLAQQ